MKKILVPTDFSTPSKSGIRFAMQWASYQKSELVFVHILYIPRPPKWSDAHYESFSNEQEKLIRIKFEKFIAGMYQQMNIKAGKHSFTIIQGISADICILDYCRKNKQIDFICISTHGAGKFNRVFGTNTGNLITKSTIPVLALPKNYKVTPVNSVLYATDFKNYPQELKKVADFALPFKAAIDVLHFAWPNEIIFDEKIIASAFKKEYKYAVKVHLEKNDAIHSFIQNLQQQVALKKPAVVIMFTNQERTLFQKIFLSSKAEELSFQLKVPLLVFNKSNTK